MTLRHYLIFCFSVLALCLTGGSAFAQDAGMSDLEIINDESNEEEERPMFFPGEDLRYVPKASGISSAKDSVAVRRPEVLPNQKSPEKAAKSKDESILTFNFLYYMIQKYKLQDIID